jgi:hypothetical protein
MGKPIENVKERVTAIEASARKDLRSKMKQPVSQELEEQVLNAIWAATYPETDREVILDTFSKGCWLKLCQLLDEHCTDEPLQVRWGNDDVNERGPLKKGETLIGTWNIKEDDKCLETIYAFENNVIHVFPRGPGASNAGPIIFTN